MASKVTDSVRIPLQENVYQPTTDGLYEGSVTENKERPRGSVFLYLSAFSACMLTFGLANIVVWTSPATSRLLSNNREENPLGTPISTVQLSFLGGLPMFGSIFGPLFLTKLCDVIGRRKSLMCFSVMMLVANITLAFSETLWLYYVTRFVSGVAMGAAVVCVSIFLSEIAEDHNRGSIGCLIGLSFPLGNLYTYVLGPLLSIKNFTLLCSIPYIIQLITFVAFVPESPVFFASKGKGKAAVRSLKKLRNKSVQGIEKEYDQIVVTLKHNEQNERGLTALLTTRSSRKGLIISIGLSIIQQLSGVGAILAFAAPIFDAAHTGIPGHTVGILIGVIKLCSVFLATVIIDRSGRRPLLMCSMMGCGVAMFVLGLYFYLKSVNFVFLHISYLPILAVLVYFVFYGIGIGAIVASIMSELFPSNIRSTAVSITTVVNYIFCLAVTISFPILAKIFGETWCLWGYSIGSFGGFVFIYLLVPEIKGKSILEVQELLGR